MKDTVTYAHIILNEIEKLQQQSEVIQLGSRKKEKELIDQIHKYQIAFIQTLY